MAARLQNELRQLRKRRPFGCYARPRAGAIGEWEAQIYAHGRYYRLVLLFPGTYPEDPPAAVFKGPVFHPNVYDSGDVCLDLLSTNWRPSITVGDVLAGLARLIEEPNPQSPANPAAARLFTKDPAAYWKRADETALQGGGDTYRVL